MDFGKMWEMRLDLADTSMSAASTCPTIDVVWDDDTKQIESIVISPPDESATTVDISGREGRLEDMLRNGKKIPHGPPPPAMVVAQAPAPTETCVKRAFLGSIGSGSAGIC
jgi:hypothetical protein